MARVKIESIIKNTTMEEYTSVRGHKVYYISPIDGHTLHHKVRDDYDEENREIIYGFSTASVSVPVDYDFETNPDNIFAILESEIENYQVNEI